MNLEPSGFLEKVGKYKSNSRYTSGFPSCKAIWAQVTRFGSARRSGHDGILNSALLFNKCFRVHRRSLMLKFLTMLTAFTWKRTSPGNLKKKTVEQPALRVVSRRLGHTTRSVLDFLSLLIRFCFCFRPVNQPASIFFWWGTSNQMGGGIVFQTRVQAAHTQKNWTTSHCHESVEKQIYSNVVIGCNVAMLSSPSFSTACRAHKLTRKLSRDSEQLYSSIQVCSFFSFPFSFFSKFHPRPRHTQVKCYAVVVFLGICSVINKIPLWCLVTFLQKWSMVMFERNFYCIAQC